MATVIQATKAGNLRDIISADCAFTILVSGNPDDFIAKVGIGHLVQNLAVPAAETVLLCPVFLAVEIPEMLCTRHLNKGVIQPIVEVVGVALTISAP